MALSNFWHFRHCRHFLMFSTPFLIFRWIFEILDYFSAYSRSPRTRAGNSLIGFLSGSLVFCPKMSEWAIRSKKCAIHSFANFWWATWAIRSHCSFLVSDLSDSLTLLIKREGMNESLGFFNLQKNVQKRAKKYNFNQIFLNESLVFCDQKSK